MAAEGMEDRPAALAAHYRALAPGLLLYARQWHDAAEAEEIVQEAFLALLAQPRPPVQVHPWLLRAVRNRAINRRRGKQRRRRRERAAGAARVAWFESRPEELLDAQQAAERLARLPLEQREVVVLRIWNDLTFSQIAAIVQRPTTTVFRQFRQALAILRKEMEACTATKSTNPS